MTTESNTQYEQAFLQALVATWPRRGRSLLEIGCGHGAMLDHFWESGFDVTGFDNRQDLLQKAQERMGSRADWSFGQYDYVPFEDKSFDYVALLHVLSASSPTLSPQLVLDKAKRKAIIKEALRLASRGVLIAVENPWSIAHCNKKTAIHLPHLLYTVWRCLREQDMDARLSFGSVLHGPRWTWAPQRKRRLYEMLNNGSLYSPFGATLFLRIDMGVDRAVTPLLLRTTERVRTPMEAYPPTILGQEKGSGAMPLHGLDTKE